MESLAGALNQEGSLFLVLRLRRLNREAPSGVSNGSEGHWVVGRIALCHEPPPSHPETDLPEAKQLHLCLTLTFVLEPQFPL